jgi:hypothetical protein
VDLAVGLDDAKRIGYGVGYDRGGEAYYGGAAAA